MTTQSFWAVLHDAEIADISSEPKARTVRVVADITHLRGFLHLPEETRWKFTVNAVRVLSARAFEFWPSPSPDMAGLTRDEERAAVGEWQA